MFSGDVSTTVRCDKSGPGKTLAKTVNPPADPYSFTKGTEKYYVGGSYVTTKNATP